MIVPLRVIDSSIAYFKKYVALDTLDILFQIYLISEMWMMEGFII
jgi:hypothetical protein